MVLLKIQALASLVASSGEFLEERLDRVRTYYDLLTIPFEVSDLNCLTHTFRDVYSWIVSTVSVTLRSIYKPRKDHFILMRCSINPCAPKTFPVSGEPKLSGCCRHLLHWCLRMTPYSAYQSEFLCSSGVTFNFATIRDCIMRYADGLSGRKYTVESRICYFWLAESFSRIVAVQVQNVGTENANH